MKEELDTIFDNVNNWLKYAETKSATLLAANGVMTFGIVRILTSWNVESLLLTIYLVFVVALLLLSMTILLVSFSPSLDIPWLFKLKDPNNKKDNLLYFEHISKYTPQVYLDSLASAVSAEGNGTNDYELMQAKQIIANSVIARRKFAIFNIAIWITISAVITPIFAWLIKDKSH